MPFNSDTAKIHGQKGGLKTKERMLAHDPHYYEKIGARGGQVMKSRDPEHFRNIGKMGKKGGK